MWSGFRLTTSQELFLWGALGWFLSLLEKVLSMIMSLRLIYSKLPECSWVQVLRSEEPEVSLHPTPVPLQDSQFLFAPTCLRWGAHPFSRVLESSHPRKPSIQRPKGSLPIVVPSYEEGNRETFFMVTLE